MKTFGSHGLEVETAAFYRAQLRSEMFRVVVVIGAVLAILLLQAVRILFLRSHAHEDSMRLAAQLVLGGSLVLYELFALGSTKRALRSGSAVSGFIWLSPIVLESAIPSLALAMLTSPAIAAPYRPLANPIVLTFFFFLILSVLRLRPSVSLMSGFMAAGSFLCASYYLGWRPELNSQSSIQSPERAVISYALLLVLSGAVAGAVAREVQKYVLSALRAAENKRYLERLQHDMNVARSVQQSLLPSDVPRIKGFEVAGWNLPAEETGGDFYDWQVFPNGKAVLVLADVTGHGLGPAMLAAVCRAYARANLGIQDGLLTAIERINAALVQDLTPGRFATLVAAICSPDSSRVELLSAGHGPLFIYVFREDRMESMGAQALPLGIAPALSADPPQDLNLNKGDLLVLVTDGFYEWENTTGQQFGTERLEQVVRQVRERNPKEIIDALYKSALEFSEGTQQQDDLTAIILKRTA
jgi:serine phosphatase RsbU (regulator of sigma subunit)